MTSDQILERVSRVVGDTLELDDVALTRSTKASEVEGWDSLSHLTIIMAVEREFGIRFRTGEIAGLMNVGDLVGRVEVCLARHTSPER